MAKGAGLMGAPDCGICEVLGYRSCDRCGDVVFDLSPLGLEVCGYCLAGDAAGSGREGHARGKSA